MAAARICVFICPKEQEAPKTDYVVSKAGWFHRHSSGFIAITCPFSLFVCEKTPTI